MGWLMDTISSSSLVNIDCDQKGVDQRYKLQKMKKYQCMHAWDVIYISRFGSEETSTTGWFIWGFSKSTSKFDEGMVAFLSCLQEICEYATEQSQLHFPYVYATSDHCFNLV